MERIWLKHYPPGVPPDIDPSVAPTLVHILEQSFRTYRDRDAVAFMGTRLTFGEIDAASRAFGAFLQNRGLSRGARIGIMMPNCPQYVVAIAGILRAGFTVVNINPLYKTRELELQLKDADAEAILVLENFACVLQEALPRTPIKHIVVASIADMMGMLKGTIVNLVARHVKKMVPHYTLPGAIQFNDALTTGRSLVLADPKTGPDDIAFLQYTGGTTGVPKGAVLLHRNLVANTLQIGEWLQPLMRPEDKERAIVIVAALPLYHIFALTACFLLGMRLGGTCVLIPNPRDLPALIGEAKKYKPHIFPAVNTLFNALLHHRDFGKLDWSELRCAVGGGMAVQKAVADAWYKATGKPIIEGYGLSETSPVLCCNRGDIAEWTGTIGLPLPSTEVVIRDDNNSDLPLGERGEICARGPQVMPGYWQRPDETAQVMTTDGFFRTGDIGIMDDQGRIKIVDRKKDMISVSGFKVFPNEVEEVAMLHGGLLEAACVGVPDEKSGEAVKLFAVRKSDNVSVADLRVFLADRLTPYKMPKTIEFRTELPKTNVGKILRRALRDEAMQSSSTAA